MQALDLELAHLGFAMSTQLSERVRSIPLDAATQLLRFIVDVLSEALGADGAHEPLFRDFPDGVPKNTSELWMRRVIAHFAQAEDQPCLFCHRTGTTHVLEPCHHVVCEHCFDGSNYSGCPICGVKADPGTPFFRPAEPRPPGDEHARYKLLLTGDDLVEEARTMFGALCARTQALSPDDRADLTTILDEFGATVLGWVPDTIPLRENIARVFGVLFDACDPSEVLEVARKHMTTATDVLRFIAAYSGADPALQPVTKVAYIDAEVAPPALVKRIARLFGADAPSRFLKYPHQVKVHRFEVARMRRSLRRALLGVLESLDPNLLIEDMLRHQSYWVWVGQFLHPHEYASRFPNTARAFQIVRKKAPDGTPAPRTETFNSRVEAAVKADDAVALTDILAERPGELARRFDHALRLASDDEAANHVLSTFEELVPRFTTPVLLTLYATLPTRREPAPVRIFWPAGNTATGVSRKDTRPTLRPDHVDRATTAARDELLARFARKSGPRDWIVDEALADIVVPFNERTASSSAVPLTRGSSIAVASSKTARLFIHWCEPPEGWMTDLDLSVGFYGADWTYRGVCSYYEITCAIDGDTIARSSGDFTSAPWPDGASEFVDIDREAAAAHGIRYAVMVVTAYAGLPFGGLDRAFAGLMFRDDIGGKHFDPRTVELKFDLQGAHGVYLPLVFDLQTDRLHWLDTYSRGDFFFNNVENANNAITHLCPESLAYFASGVRPSMLELGLLNAAARADRVFLRGESMRCFTRLPGESATDFLTRLRRSEGGELVGELPRGAVVALLQHGDIAVADGSSVYALFREQLAPNLAASDLLA